MPIKTIALRTLPVFLFSIPVFAQTANDCSLQYPIVISHQYGAAEICPDKWTPTECMTREAENLAKYCADWNDEIGCRQWVLPADEAHLPPLAQNRYAPNLKRSASAIARHHRHISKDVVDRLESCGNRVFLSDKPTYASYQIRAASLRRTVLEALAETGAEKVVILGFSQGVQDARLMTATLPVDDKDPTAGVMKDHVAAVVGLAGEHEGAEVATLAIALLYSTSYSDDGNWLTGSTTEAIWNNQGGIEHQTETMWRDTGSAAATSDLSELPLVLTEGYDRNNPQEYDLQPQMQLRTFLHATTNLSNQYMEADSWKNEEAWTALREQLGIAEYSWEELVNADNEACNGVEYFSYGLQIRNWDWTQWGDPTFFFLVSSIYGANDNYVTVTSQNFERINYPVCADGQRNFHHVKTLNGNLLGNGYHHLFFSGRNASYGPATDWLQERPPYNGTAADVYEQVLRDLVARGF